MSVASGSSRSLRLVFRKMPQLVLQRLDLSFRIHQLMFFSPKMNRNSCVLLRTLQVVLRLNAFKFEPAPVQDFVCEDGDQGGLEDWSTAVFVEIALFDISDCFGERRSAVIDIRAGCSWASPLSLVLLGVGRWIACDVGRWARGA
jgi:hypothetical protein